MSQPIGPRDPETSELLDLLCAKFGVVRQGLRSLVLTLNMEQPVTIVTDHIAMRTPSDKQDEQ